ncbi:DUF6350 family protein [Glaciihabitans sp. dw_435]|uniref:cell division protein PerM n=1 Tax=Glaciihabitans sp. dw_435 TaxID=2720081 RepID=UPI001BD5AF17|nr:DUF6350 family protein [Glaciihabitans sp. dw_435]
MNRSLTSLFAAFEALLVVAIGIGIPLAPLTVLWALQFGFAPDWTDFWRSSVDIWLIGHGVDVTFTLDAATVKSLGLDGAGTPFIVTAAALGIALLTIVLGARAGRRIAQTDYRLIGNAVAIGVFALCAAGVTLSARAAGASPSLPQGIILPSLIFALGVTIGSLRTQRAATDATGSSIRDWIADWQPTTRAAVATALRGGTAAAAAVVAAGSVIVAVLIFSSYAEIITLYEGLHTEGLGGFALTLAQLAFLPNLVIWGVSWLVGPGFAIGVGSSVSPLGTSLGPIPAVPVLGALPLGDSSFGYIGLLVPIVAAFVCAALLRGRLLAVTGGPTGARGMSRTAPARRRVPAGSDNDLTQPLDLGDNDLTQPLNFDERPTPNAGIIPRLLATGLGMGVVGGALLGLLAWASSGAAGPGRLHQVGPDPLVVGLWAALEIGVAAVLGLLAAGHLPSRERAPRS